MKKNWKYSSEYQGDYWGTEHDVVPEVDGRDLRLKLEFMELPGQEEGEYLVGGDCMIVLENFRLIGEQPQVIPEETQARIRNILDNTQYNRAYMTFREFCESYSEDTDIRFAGEKKELRLSGYGNQALNGALWVHLRFGCDRIRYYWNEVYSYATGERIDGE